MILSNKTAASVLIPGSMVIIQKIIAKLLSFFKQNSLFLNYANRPLIKLLLISIFFLSLCLPPNFNFELSTYTSSKVDEEILSQRHYGISLFSVSNISLGLLLLLFLTQLRISKTEVKLNPLDIYFGIFLAVALLSVATSHNFDASFAWVLKLLFGIGIYLILSSITLEKIHYRTILYLSIFMIFIQGFLAIFQFIQGGLLGSPIENIRNLLLNEGVFSIQQNRYFRVVGSLSHPSSLGAFSALLTPLAVVFALTQKIPKFFSYLAILTCLLIQLLAFSRWGLVTTLFSIVITLMLILPLRSISYRVIFRHFTTSIILIIVMALPFLLSQTIISRFSNISFEDASLSARLALIDQAIFTIKEYPLLGIGGGNFVPNLINNDVTDSKISRTFPAPVHSTYFLFFSELGLVGFILILSQIGLIIWLFKSRVNSLSEAEKLMATALFCSCLSFFFNGLWDARGFSDRIGFLYFFNLALMVNILRQKSIRFNFGF